MDPSTYATSQYASTTHKLAARIAIYSYSANPQPWFSWLGERLDVNGDVLEVGAGTGELWKHADYSNAQLTLVDFSPAMCEKLRDVPGATVRQCDAASLPFEDNSFDLVIANHMLYHVNNPDAALKEFARVLRPGGRVVVSLNGREHMKELKEIGQSIGKPSTVSSTTRITAETSIEALGRHFVNLTTEEYSGDLRIVTPEPLLNYLNSLGESGLSTQEELTARQMVLDEISKSGSFRIQGHVEVIMGTYP